jgi:hypothetical protein
LTFSQTAFWTATSRFWVFGSRLAIGGFIAAGHLVEIGFYAFWGKIRWKNKKKQAEKMLEN